MDRRTGSRLTIAAGLAIGLSFGIAPQWVSGAPDGGDATATGTTTTEAHQTVIPEFEDLRPSTTAPSTTAPSTTAPSTTAPSTTAPSTTAPPATPRPTAPSAPTIVEPVDIAPVTTLAPATEAIERPAPAHASTAGADTVSEVPAPASTHAVHVDVPAAEGATRLVTLRSASGSPVGDIVEVDGTRITFDGLADGSYHVFVEEFSDGGGTFMTRTAIVVSAGDVVATCDAQTLDCTVA